MGSNEKDSFYQSKGKSEKNHCCVSLKMCPKGGKMRGVKCPHCGKEFYVGYNELKRLGFLLILIFPYPRVFLFRDKKRKWLRRPRRK